MDVMIARADKILSELGLGSRQEIKKYIKSKRVKVNGEILKRPEEKIDTEKDEIFFDGKIVEVSEFETYILYKPAGFVCATKDNLHRTVMELISSKRKNIVPVGRLDLDTEGLLLLTNDGDLNHRLLSPKSHVDKKYYAIFEGKLSNDAVDKTLKGLDIGNGEISSPSKLEIISENELILTIHEGKFHQVKRMVKALGAEVTYLKRTAFGGLILDDLGLKKGESRRISDKELEILNSR
jgi:pseudouridylate synthase